jgi:hypothetical protein
VGGAVPPEVVPRRGAAILADGALAGLAAGTIFLLFEFVAVTLTGHPWALPLGMMASIFLGQAATAPGSSVAAAIVAGLVAHAVISVFWGAIFAGIMSGLRIRNRPLLLSAGAIFGLAVWIIDFYVMTIVAWRWLREENVLVQFAGHTFFYGLPLGCMLVLMWQRRPAL